MKKIIAALVSVFAHPHPESLPEIVIEPNDRGGWSMRWDPSAKQFGNYATAADAERIARINFGLVRIVAKTTAPSPVTLEASA
jgi:hypothetical protein